MNTQVLIDGIVRQTTVLIAHVATAAGARAQLAGVASHVFLDLAQALEEQGVRRKVAADMFGMALRSYQQKVRRLTESVSDSDVTLWEAIHRHIAAHKVVTRQDISERFARDDAASVAGVLRDMVDSGLVYRAGRGDSALYRIAAQEEVELAMTMDSGQTAEALVWVAIYEHGPLERGRIQDFVRVGDAEVDRALEGLLRDGRIRIVEGASEVSYSSDKVLIPLGDSAGWGASLLDHHQVVVASICAKLRGGQRRALPADQQGGSTFSFDIWSGHPCEAQALQLLSTTRQQLQQLWGQVTSHNASGKPSSFKRVTFYCGQMVAEDFLDQQSGEAGLASDITPQEGQT